MGVEYRGASVQETEISNRYGYRDYFGQEEFKVKQTELVACARNFLVLIESVCVGIIIMLA